MQTLANRYDVVRQLGRGSFGHTFLARDRETQRDVAIKMFDPKAASDWKAQQLFEREAAVLRALRHHGVPEIYDYLRTEQDGNTVAVLVMEYIEGASILQMIDEQRLLDPDSVLHLLLELLSVLEYLHTRVPPILHRDIKPSNIIVRPDGSPVLVDFGSVRRVFLREDESGSTIAGTYGYMPYEQYMGQATPSSDLYSLGATMLHLVTGRAPRDFIGDSGAIVVPETPGDARVAAVLKRMLQSSPADRFSSAREARTALIAPTAVATIPARRSTAIALKDTERLPEQRPRVMDAQLQTLLRRLWPRMYTLVDASTKPTDRASMPEVMAMVFYGAITFGVLPAAYHVVARARRRRIKHFLLNGVEAVGEVRNIGSESTNFGEKFAKVTYDFMVDGETHRNADRVLPAIAQRWAPGDPIRVLYIPEEDYDSIIISTR